MHGQSGKKKNAKLTCVRLSKRHGVNVCDWHTWSGFDGDGRTVTSRRQQQQQQQRPRGRRSTRFAVACGGGGGGDGCGARPGQLMTLSRRSAYCCPSRRLRCDVLYYMRGGGGRSASCKSPPLWRTGIAEC